MNKKELWETFISRIRLKELLFFKSLEQNIGDIFLNSTFIKMECKLLSEHNKVFEYYKGTIKDIILDVVVKWGNEEYLIRYGKALEINIWHKGNELMWEMENEEKYERIVNIMDSLMNEYIEKENLSTKPFDINKALKMEYKKIEKEK